MKQELRYTLEVERDGKTFSFIMSGDAGLGMAADVAYEMFATLKKNYDERYKKIEECKKEDDAKKEAENVNS